MRPASMDIITLLAASGRVETAALLDFHEDLQRVDRLALATAFEALRAKAAKDPASVTAQARPAPPGAGDSPGDAAPATDGATVKDAPKPTAYTRVAKAQRRLAMPAKAFTAQLAAALEAAHPSLTALPKADRASLSKYVAAAEAALGPAPVINAAENLAAAQAIGFGG